MKIPGFKLDTRKGNDVHYGRLYNRHIEMPFAYGKYQNRMMRVWVPGDFDINKEYGVLYMSDGQNAVDENLTAYGEWNMEDHFLELEKEGYPQFIIVGIDCPRNGLNRFLEYLPFKGNTKVGRNCKGYYGDRYADFIVHNIMPFINSRFKIRQDLVGFCGSSMGGLISFYICSKYPELFKFCISFSPAFFFYSKSLIKRQFEARGFNKETFPDYAFFIGGADDLERHLKVNSDYVVSLLQEAGFDEDKLIYLVDESRIHHESTWSDFIEDALRFVLRNYKN